MNKSAKKLYREAVETLKAAGVENTAAEARWLAERFFCCSAAELAMDFEVENPSAFLRAVQTRATGEPLQYIIGTQDFMGLEIKVARGVLIPRPETELLVRAGARAVPKAKIVWDLCAGSGCVGLGLQQLLPDAKVFFVEKYAAALKILRENVGDRENCAVVRADILKNKLTKLPAPDLILCNPPYIPKDDIPNLQREVLREPCTALDGGEDGLKFYRVLTELAEKRLKEDGALCAELGVGQAADAKEMFCGFTINIDRDESGIERVITMKSINAIK
ncbi:MAG TPA: peptide chain release factor N(5)-glutamine methyltransferase [Oscillospiraceae bacterium]|nr:peptide chain release factor N(5)-glutamine methyltransferase [Oscillospiraceae bacterium]HPF56720.1 peptide chain release factor N(5)-glutamine methyltransferase [Clostridiales bacterium]HPK35414.1 peptide chain release factor N(5)-glutamine methyltransferase [Oscillospiraceae bacterium]HPR75293.1 peptide chain release factor N(5)-glutamine methyltransferase [Oscillospiraceae bacterium]